jgi:ABC-2 type transport system ATP-binding protein
MADALLQVKDLRKTYDDGFKAVKGVSFEVKRGEVFGILGPNGAGKTTTLEMIEGLRPITYAESSDAMELLREVGLEDKAHSRAKELSGGQKQRFSIATTLVNKPVAVFLDEPTTGLDPQARRNLWDLVQSIQKKGTTVILTTHYMEEAQVLCDRVAIMDEGKIIALDTPGHLINQLLKRGFKPHTQVQAATLEDVFIDLTGKDLRD